MTVVFYYVRLRYLFVEGFTMFCVIHAVAIIGFHIMQYSVNISVIANIRARDHRVKTKISIGALTKTRLLRFIYSLF